MKSHSKALVRVLTERLGFVQIGAEIGAWKGDLSADLLRSFPELYLHMVDLWDPIAASDTMNEQDVVDIRQTKLEAERATEFAAHRRRLWQLDSAAAAGRWPDGVFDFAFIDASHLHECVRRDTAAWYPKIKRRGIMAWHDYDGVGDRRKGWGVKRAVDEFAAEYGYEVTVERCRGNVAWIMK